MSRCAIAPVVAVTITARAALVAPLVPAALTPTGRVAVAPLERTVVTARVAASAPEATLLAVTPETTAVTAAAPEPATFTVTPGGTTDHRHRYGRSGNHRDRQPHRRALPVAATVAVAPEAACVTAVAVAEPAPIAAAIAVAIVAEATGAAAPALVEAATRLAAVEAAARPVRARTIATLRPASAAEPTGRVTIGPGREVVAATVRGTSGAAT